MVVLSAMAQNNKASHIREDKMNYKEIQDNTKLIMGESYI